MKWDEQEALLFSVKAFSSEKTRGRVLQSRRRESCRPCLGSSVKTLERELFLEFLFFHQRENLS